jgi:hypothetical protein
MIDDPAVKARQQRNLIDDQKKYLLGEEASAPAGDASLKDERKALAHARNASFSLNGFERNFFFEDIGSEYRHLGATSGADSNIDARSFAAADMDRDGDLDIVVKNLQVRLLQLFRNDYDTTNARVFFRLRGHESNRDGVGARIEIRHGDRFQMAEVKSACGFQSQSPNEVFFGLGPDDTIDHVEVFWPSGKRQAFEDLPAGHFYDVDERSGIANRRELGAVPVSSGPAPEAPSDGARQMVYTDPRPAPLFRVDDLDGEALSARETYGEGPTVVSFMTTWTPSYAEDLDTLAELKRAHPKLQVVVFLVELPGILTDPARTNLARAAGFHVATCDTQFAERFSGQPNIVFPRTSVVRDSKVVLDVLQSLAVEGTAEQIAESVR